ncbi:MAG: hypothetical protein GY830_01060 [Bacteroidetes bacterium]|nr:hypothetical protein [Bacteroidota bacterium]
MMNPFLLKMLDLRNILKYFIFKFFFISFLLFNLFSLFGCSNDTKKKKKRRKKVNSESIGALNVGKAKEISDKDLQQILKNIENSNEQVSTEIIDALKNKSQENEIEQTKNKDENPDEDIDQAEKQNFSKININSSTIKTDENEIEKNIQESEDLNNTSNNLNDSEEKINSSNDFTSDDYINNVNIITEDDNLLQELQIDKNVNVHLEFIRLLQSWKIKKAYEILKHTKFNFDWVDPRNQKELLTYVLLQSLYKLPTNIKKEQSEYIEKILIIFLQKKTNLNIFEKYTLTMNQKKYKYSIIDIILENFYVSALENFLQINPNFDVNTFFVHDNINAPLLYHCFKRPNKNMINFVKLLINHGAKLKFNIEHTFKSKEKMKISILHALILLSKKFYEIKKQVIDYMKLHCVDFDLNYKGECQFTPTKFADMLDDKDKSFHDYLIINLGGKY